MPASLPETFAFQRARQGNVVTIVASTLTLEQSHLDPTADLVLFADALTIESALSIPERTVRIVTRTLTATGHAGLDTSARPPAPPVPQAAAVGRQTQADARGGDGAAGAGGASGGHGGAVWLQALSIDGALSITSRGGDGQAGQQGQNGGDGGAGAFGRDTIIASGNRRITSAAERGHNGGAGGNGGRGGASGGGGNAGAIHILSPDAAKVAVHLSAGRAAAAARGGAGGHGGEPGLGGRKASETFIPGRDAHMRYDLSDQREASGARGADGAGGQDGSRGTDGGAGEVVVQKPMALARLVSPGETPAALAYLHLLLQQAKLLYLAGEYARAQAVLTWIADMAPAGSDQKMREWNALAANAEALLGQLAQSVDFFGRSADWVPLVSFEYYQAALTGMLTLGMQIEQNYNTYSAWLQNQAAAFTGAREIIDRGNDAVAKFEEARGNADTQLAELTRAIDTLTTETARKQQLVVKAGQDFQLAVERKARECTYADMLMALQTIVAIGSSAYNIADALKSLAKLDPDKGPIGAIVKQVKTVVTSLADMRKAYLAIADTITPETPDASKLLVEQDKFDKMIGEYLDLPEARDYKGLVHDFVGTVGARNGKIMERENLFAARAKWNATIDRKRGEIDRLAADAAAIRDPSLPQFRTYVAGLYNDFKEHYLEHVYNEHQAYRYWALAPADPFAISDRSIDGMAKYHTDLQSRTFQAINSVLSPKQPFTELTIRIVPPVDRSLPDPLDGFRSTRMLTFQIPPDVRAFGGLAQVMATSFSIVLRGARPSAPASLVYVRLWHQGKGTVFDPKGRRFDFSHERVMSVYEYELAADGTVRAKAGGNLGGGSDRRIGLTPFASWTIELPDKLNEGLDLSGLTEIVLAFSGSALPVAPERLAATHVTGAGVAVIDRPAGYAVL